MNKWKLWLIPLLLLLALGIWKGSGSRAQEPVNQNVNVQTVATRVVEKITKDNNLDLTGNVDSIKRAVISAKAAGRVGQILVDNGDQVVNGQSLVLVESQDYRNSLDANLAAVNKAEAALQLIQLNYNRTKTLCDQGAAPQKDLDSMEASLRGAEADVASARAASALVEESLNNTNIISTINGLVANRNVNIGQIVAAGTPVMTVEDISAVYVLVNIDQNDLNNIKVGAAADVWIDAASQTNQKLSGVIENINPVANKAARVFEIKIRVENPDKVLKPGVFAHVSIKTGQSEEIMAVPQNALTSNKGLYFVFIADGDRVERQQVVIGSMIGQMVEIKSGLSPGQIVVISNVNKLKDQDRIQIAN